jgi:hypothetical protein
MPEVLSAYDRKLKEKVISVFNRDFINWFRRLKLRTPEAASDFDKSIDMMRGFTIHKFEDLMLSVKRHTINLLPYLISGDKRFLEGLCAAARKSEYNVFPEAFLDKTTNMSEEDKTVIKNEFMPFVDQIAAVHDDYRDALRNARSKVAAQ